MADEIGISLNMNPHWVMDGDLAGFLTPLRQAGLDTLEFELDRYLPEWPQVQPLMEQCADSGMHICFHAPYRKPHHVDGFVHGSRAEIIEQYRPAFEIAERWAQRQGRGVNVVIHGAVSGAAERADLRADTVQFLDWALESFTGLCLALENNAPPAPGILKTGDSRESVLEVVDELNHHRLKVCWDMGHDYLSGSAPEVAPEWLDKVIHTHVHDVDAEGRDHYPLVFGRVPYTAWLPLLAKGHTLKVATLEIKGGLMKGWSPELVGQLLVESITTIRRGLQ